MHPPPVAGEHIVADDAPEAMPYHDDSIHLRVRVQPGQQRDAGLPDGLPHLHVLGPRARVARRVADHVDDGAQEVPEHGRKPDDPGQEQQATDQRVLQQRLAIAPHRHRTGQHQHGRRHRRDLESP